MGLELIVTLESPPAPLGDGRGEAPGRGFGGEPDRGRAGVRSAGCGAAAPRLCRKQWIQASIRTRAGDGSAAFRGAVHVLIRCFHDCHPGKGWNVTFLFSHSGGARWQA
jgi:hypothetical protein